VPKSGDEGYSFEQIIEKYKDVIVHKGKACDYVYEFINDCYDVDSTPHKLNQ
jgi:hypothetical protein